MPANGEGSAINKPIPADINKPTPAYISGPIPADVNRPIPADINKPIPADNIQLGFPVYSVDYVPKTATVFVAGGGGPGKTGVKNSIVHILLFDNSI